jgi:hypothetical protein
MVETMETWIVADPDALAAYYGQRFRTNALPHHQDLEELAKIFVATALEQATRHTQKGAYRKIRHASDLLKRIAPQKVRRRCPSCERMFITLGNTIAGG